MPLPKHPNPNTDRYPWLHPAPPFFEGLVEIDNLNSFYVSIAVVVSPVVYVNPAGVNNPLWNLALTDLGNTLQGSIIYDANQNPLAAGGYSVPIYLQWNGVTYSGYSSVNTNDADGAPLDGRSLASFPGLNVSELLVAAYVPAGGFGEPALGESQVVPLYLSLTEVNFHSKQASPSSGSPVLIAGNSFSLSLLPWSATLKVGAHTYGVIGPFKGPV